MKVKLDEKTDTQEDGSFSMTKKETELVLVEAISSFRIRYLIEVPKGCKDYALETVTMNEASEFGQQHIGEQISSHRVISEDEILELAQEDNEFYTLDSPGFPDYLITKLKM